MYILTYIAGAVLAPFFSAEQVVQQFIQSLGSGPNTPYPLPPCYPCND